MAVTGNFAPAKVSLSFWTGERFGLRDGVDLRIEDSISGSTICELTLSRLEFANLLAQVQCRPALLEWHGQSFGAIFGKIREHKDEAVTVPDYRDLAERAAVISEAVAPFEVEGWRGNRADASNHHQWIKPPNVYRVGFTRFVEPTEEALAARLEYLHECGFMPEGLPESLQRKPATK